MAFGSLLHGEPPCLIPPKVTPSPAGPTGASSVPTRGSPDFVTQEMSQFADAYGVRFFQRDITKNEIRPTTTDVPKWMTYYLKDSSGYYTTNFEFALQSGENKITLEGQNEPMSIKSITLYPIEKIDSYEAYIAQYAGVPAGKDTIKIEAELANVMSNKTIYPVEDRSCAINSPTDTTCSILNTIGGDKWATAGQWVEYRFKQDISFTSLRNYFPVTL